MDRRAGRGEGEGAEKELRERRLTAPPSLRPQVPKPLDGASWEILSYILFLVLPLERFSCTEPFKVPVHLLLVTVLSTWSRTTRWENIGTAAAAGTHIPRFVGPNMFCVNVLRQKCFMDPGVAPVESGEAPL